MSPIVFVSERGVHRKATDDECLVGKVAKLPPTVKEGTPAVSLRMIYEIPGHLFPRSSVKR